MKDDRLKSALRGLIRELLPNLAFVMPVLYRVATASGGKWSGNPVSKGRGLPPIKDAPIRGSIAGGHSATELARGTIVVVQFVDAGEGEAPQPYLAAIHSEPKTLALKATTSATIDAPQVVINEGVQGAARMGDPILAGGIFAGTITAGSTTTKVG